MTKRGTGRTTTTLVPLKGLEESSPLPASRRSARSRKSEIGSSPIKGGGVAALVRKRGRQTTFGEDDAGRDLSVGATPGKRGRGRPRKSLPVVGDEDVVMMEGERSEPAAKSPAKKARGRRKAISPNNIAQDEDVDGDLFGRRGKPLVRDGSVALGETSPNRSGSASPRKGVSAAHSDSTAVSKTAQRSDSLKDTSQHDLNSARNDRRRSETPSHTTHPPLSTAAEDDHVGGDVQAMLGDPTIDHREFDSILESEGFSMVSLESIESARQNLSSITNQSLRSQAESAKTKESFLTDPALHPPRLGERTPAVDGFENGGIADIQQEASLDGGNPLIVNSSSQYSKSVGGSRKTISPHQPKHGTGKSVSFSALNEVIEPDSSEPSARQASVTTRYAAEKQPFNQTTPVRVDSSRKLPPPIQQEVPPNSSNPASKPKRETPKLSGVVRTAIALQGVLDSNGRETSVQGSSLRSPYISPANRRSSNNVAGKSPKERLDDLFEGFGAGTRRELRAGLRLGEELARRHKLAAQAQQVGEPSGELASEEDMLTEPNDTGYPKLPTPEDKDDYALAIPAPTPQQEIEYPSLQPEQLLSPERSEREDEMDWQVDTPVKTQDLSLSDPISDQDTSEETLASSFTQAREAQWQREREAVSREIQMANSSQVIVINSDDTEAVDEQEALQDEASSAVDVNIRQPETNSANHSQASQTIDEALFTEEIVKPRRSKIPSPWRRDSQMVYSDEATEDPSGLFWQPDQRAIQLAKEREERKRRKESHLDVSGMLKPTEKVNEETRAITDDSMDARVQQELQKKAEFVVVEETISQVEMTVKSSYHSEEVIVAAAQGVQTPGVDAGAEETCHSEEAVATVQEQHLEIEANAEAIYDSEEDMMFAEGEQSPDVESNAETIYYSDAEAEAEVEEASYAASDDELPTPESESVDEDTEYNLEAHEASITSNAHTKPAAPRASQSTSWLRKITSIASSLFWDTTPKESWTNAHYLLLDTLYQSAKTDMTAFPYNPDGGLWGFRIYLGTTLVYNNYQLKISKSHVAIAQAFREQLRVASLKVGGDGSVEWGEYYLVKRLFSLMVGEDMRAKGIPFPEQDAQGREVRRDEGGWWG